MCTPQLPLGISSHGTRQSPHLPPGLTEAAESFSALLRQLQTASDHMEKVAFLFGGLFFFFFPPSIFGKAETPPQAWPRKKGRKYQGAHRARLTTEGENKILKDVGDVLAASTFQSAFVLLGLEALQSTASPPTMFTVAVTGQLIKNGDKISIANESLTSVSLHTAQLWLSTTGRH